MLFPVLFKKAYERNLQYRASHLINTVASAAFGLIYLSIWKGIGQPASGGGYTLDNIIHYVAFNQVCLWITLFITNGLGIERSVRTGQISLDLMRPVHLFYHLMCREWGQIGYHLLYKSLPIYILYLLTLHLPVPKSAVTWFWTIVASVLAAYMNICINYLIGVTALWTTESNWLFRVHNALSMVLSGFLIPIDWLPHPLQLISKMSFYPYMQYFPSKIYLGLTEAADVLSGSLLWCFLLTLMCLRASAG